MAGWDVVYGHLLELLPTLDGLSTDAVSDGPPLGDFPAFFAAVGDDGDGNAGNYTQDYGDAGLVDETGEILCRLVAQSGDEKSLPTLRATVSGWVDDLSAAFRADKTLGGLLRQGSTVAVGRVEPSQQQTQQGAVVDATVAITYFTRL